MATKIQHKHQKVTPQPSSEFSPPLPEDAAIPITKKPKGPMLDSLLGEPLPGYEGKYWQVIPADTTEAGFHISGNNIKLPKTIHIPTGSKVSYIKVYVYLTGGEKIAVWEKYQDLE